MITCEDIAGIHLDGIHTLGASILQHNTAQHEVDLILFKLDISATYCQLPIHLLFQIVQIITIDGQQYVDRNHNFGGRASQILWQSFISLIMWVLVFRWGLWVLKCYVDDAFLITRMGDVSRYAS